MNTGKWDAQNLIPDDVFVDLFGTTEARKEWRFLVRETDDKVFLVLQCNDGREISAPLDESILDNPDLYIWDEIKSLLQSQLRAMT